MIAVDPKLAMAAAALAGFAASFAAGAYVIRGDTVECLLFFASLVTIGALVWSAREKGT